MKKWNFSLSCLLVCILLCEVATAQENRERDSLVSLLPNAPKDSNLVLLYYDIGYLYELNDFQTAATYYQKGKKRSEELGYKTGLVKYAFNYSNILNVKGEYDSSLTLNKGAVELSLALQDYTLIAKSYVNTGNVFLHRQQLDSAVYYYGMAKKYTENDEFISSYISNLLASAYTNLGRYQEAIEQGRIAVDYFRKSGDAYKLGNSLVNLGNAYTETRSIDSARNLLKEALEIGRKTGYDELRQNSLLSLINTYMQDNKAADPVIRTYAEEALGIAKKQEDIGGISVSYRALGIHFHFIRNYDRSLSYLDSSLAVAQSGKLIYEEQKSLYSKGLLLISMGKLEAGNEILDASARLQARIVGNETIQQVILAEKRFESEKKETQIKLQQEQIKRKNTLNYIYLGSAIALVIFSLLIFRNYQQKQNLQKAKIEELENEKQLAATEAILKGEEQERTRLAKELHDGLGGMLSGIKFSFTNMKENLILTPENASQFERSLDMLDSSIREMRRVAHNMMPEMLLKYGLDIALKEFCNEIERSGAIKTTYQSIGMENLSIDQTVAVTTYRVVQELVNNAIKHANAQNVLVQVHASGDDKLLQLTVEDDGKGFDASMLKNTQGIGWTNIQNRVDFLKGKIDLSSSPDKGSSVLIEIPLV